MEYSTEEIAFVEFCVKNFPCDKAPRYPCPVEDTCSAQYDEEDDDSTICSGILKRMRGGAELSETERKVIQFFSDDKTSMWTGCKLRKESKSCINRRICDSKYKAGQKGVCEDLLSKLGLLLPDAKILEKAVESIICRTQNSIQWEVGEDITLCERQPSTRIGKPDILCKGNESGRLYVIELKVGVATREHVGQLASYVGWYKRHSEASKDVWGILVAEDFHEGAKYAIEVCPDLRARICKLRVDIEEVQ